MSLLLVFFSGLCLLTRPIFHFTHVSVAGVFFWLVSSNKANFSFYSCLCCWCFFSGLCLLTRPTFHFTHVSVSNSALSDRKASINRDISNIKS